MDAVTQADVLGMASQGPPPWIERLRTRIPSWGQYAARARSDSRLAVYDLLPLVATPAARDAVAALWTALRPRSPWLNPGPEGEAWLATLRHDGYARLPPLPAERTAALRRYFEAQPCHDPYRPHLGTFAWDRVPSAEVNMGYYTPQQILAGPGVLEMLNDPTVLTVAEMYLGAKPLLDNIGAWWSFGDRPAAKGTQRYHRDWDTWRGFKIFFYLSDVGPQTGPHTFIRASHRDPRLTVGRGMSDAEVLATFGAAAVVPLTGPAGSRFIADTFGVHKGALPVHGNRLLLAAHYTANATPHLPRIPWLDPDPRFDPDINRLVMRRA